MNDFRWCQCPLCGSDRLRLAGAIDYRKPIMFSTGPVELWRTPELFECGRCASWFTQNIIPKATAFELYCSGNSSAKWPRDVTLVESKHKGIIQRLDHYFRASVRVLDIGCNTGVLLDYARSKECDTTGVEPSVASQAVLLGKGHKVFSSIEQVVGKYDVITAFDLVEHLYDLPGFFKSVSNLLTERGVLVLLTGDIGSLTARWTGKNWWYLKAPEHIVFPSRKFLENVEGFKLISIDETYAALGYDRKLILALMSYLKNLLLFRPYVGLPSFGPDHMLVTLGKGGES